MMKYFLTILLLMINAAPVMAYGHDCDDKCIAERYERVRYSCEVRTATMRQERMIYVEDVGCLTVEQFEFLIELLKEAE